MTTGYCALCKHEVIDDRLYLAPKDYIDRTYEGYCGPIPIVAVLCADCMLKLAILNGEGPDDERTT